MHAVLTQSALVFLPHRRNALCETVFRLNKVRQ